MMNLDIIQICGSFFAGVHRHGRSVFLKRNEFTSPLEDLEWSKGIGPEMRVLNFG